MATRFVADALGVQAMPQKLAEALVRDASPVLRPEFPRLVPNPPRVLGRDYVFSKVYGRGLSRLTKCGCLLSYQGSLVQWKIRKRGLNMPISLILMGISGLFFVSSYFPGSRYRPPRDRAVASLIMAGSLFILICSAILLLIQHLSG